MDNDYVKNKDDKITAEDISVVENNDDVSTDFNALEPEVKIKKLRDKIKECERERLEFLSGWQRAKADFINARKDNEARRKDDILYANERLILSLIPALDSFDLAFSDKEGWEKVDKNWRRGVEYIYSQLSEALKDSGLLAFGEKNDIFEPSKHIAVDKIMTEDLKLDGLIKSILVKGYILNDRVIRPAKVNVYKSEPTPLNSA